MTKIILVNKSERLLINENIFALLSYKIIFQPQFDLSQNASYFIIKR